MSHFDHTLLFQSTSCAFHEGVLKGDVLISMDGSLPFVVVAFVLCSSIIVLSFSCLLFPLSFPSSFSGLCFPLVAILQLFTSECYPFVFYRPRCADTTCTPSQSILTSTMAG